MSPETKHFAIAAAAAAPGGANALRALGFTIVCGLPFALGWSATGTLSRLIVHDDTFSQIPLIPLVSLFLIYTDWRKLPSHIFPAWPLGVALLAPGMAAVGVTSANVWKLSATNQCSLFTFGVVLIWLGAFAIFFGREVFKAHLFPLLFLVFMIPIPEPLLSKIIYGLQMGSAYCAECFFRLGGVPYLRRGLVFALPGVSIRVAEECSGIRSSLALLITTVLAGYVFLKSAWRRLVLCLVVVPLAIFKNGLRIMVLSTLSIYVDPGFLYGNLHRRGGIVFFLLALVPMVLLLRAFQKSEKQDPAVVLLRGR